MRKLRLALFIIGTVAAFVVIALPVLAGPPEDASGLWQYTPYILDARSAGCNTIFTTFEDGVWTGTFTGTSTEDGKVVIHCKGSWSFNAIVTFDQVTVDGITGTLVMAVNGTRPTDTADWFGYWVITDGADGLENLRGHGTWWGPGAPEPGKQGDIYYDGKVHTEPG